MNFLAHMLLSGPDEEILTGNFMGDFVKGRIDDGRFAQGIAAGLALHRKIDVFAGQSPQFKQSRARLALRYGLYRGVLVDLFYDHLLVREWNRWSEEPLNRYLLRTRRIIEKHHDQLPERLQRLVAVIFDDLLPSYGEIDGIAHALLRMSRRVKRSNPLAGGETELLAHYEALREDFNAFMPEALAFAAAQIRQLGGC